MKNSYLGQSDNSSLAWNFILKMQLVSRHPVSTMKLHPEFRIFLSQSQFHTYTMLMFHRSIIKLPLLYMRLPTRLLEHMCSHNSVGSGCVDESCAYSSTIINTWWDRLKWAFGSAAINTSLLLINKRSGVEYSKKKYVVKVSSSCKSKSNR